jgi:hypothetical protein
VFEIEVRIAIPNNSDEGRRDCTKERWHEDEVIWRWI